MSMTEGYRNAIAGHGGGLITHIGLVDNTATELTGGTYARIAVTWTTASGGTIRPNADLTFNVPAGANVSGWRGFTAPTAGTNYGGGALTREDYASAGQYKLLSASTGILHASS
jgi:hypothetical protein